MRSVFRPGPLVESWLELLPPAQAATSRSVLQAALAGAPTLTAAVRWGTLVLAQGPQPVLTIAPFRKHVHLQVMRGSAIAHRFDELRGSGPGLRQLRLRCSQPVDEPLVKAIAAAAAAATR